MYEGWSYRVARVKSEMKWIKVRKDGWMSLSKEGWIRVATMNEG